MENWDIELDDIIKDYKKQVEYGINIIKEDFAWLKDIPLRITLGKENRENAATTTKDEYKGSYRHLILLSSYYFKKEGSLIELKQKNQDRFVKNYESVILHEFGHIMHDLYCAKSIFEHESISMDYYFEHIRGTMKERKFLHKTKTRIFKECNLKKKKCAEYLGKNSIRDIYEFYADCFNTYYYLLGDDTITRENTREYKAFKISEYVVNMMKNII